MSVQFYLHDDSGRIVMTGSCPESMLELQKQPGMHLQTGAATINSQYVKDGLLVDMPAKPSQHHAFNYTTELWELNSEVAWKAVRAQRDALLAATDWRLLRAAETGQPIDADWAAYRQSLRDVTTQPDPLSIDWPVAPG